MEQLLAISGLARAGSLLGDDAMLADAVAAAEFVAARMRDGAGRLMRIWNQGRASVPAFLDDFASWIEATLDLHRAGAGERWLGAALAAAEDLSARFFDPAEGDLFLTPADGEPLVHRPRSDHDGATPHSTGLAVIGLLRVADLAGRADLRRIAERVIETHAFALERAPQAFPTLARAALAAERGFSVAVVVGSPSDPATRSLATRPGVCSAPPTPSSSPSPAPSRRRVWRRTGSPAAIRRPGAPPPGSAAASPARCRSSTKTRSLRLLSALR